ncbi:MAG: tetratricopeptide repeat protein [Myxococcales bacterium]|nr:tetratricopeptide repeat protein [Myxococcales bacterium]
MATVVVIAILGAPTDARSAPPGEAEVIAVKDRAERALERMQHGDALLKLEDLHGACKAYRESIEVLQSWWVPRLALVRCGRFTGADTGELLEHATFAVKARPEIPMTHLQYALVLDDAGRRADAITEYHEALRLNPQFFEAHYRLGVLYSRDGKAGLARRHLEAVLDAQPGHVVARGLLAELCETEGDIASARRHLEALAETSRYPMQALARLIAFLERNGLKKDAAPLRVRYDRLYR